MQLIRLPGPALRPFVTRLWVAEEPVRAEREHVLPGGGMHLVFRLTAHPLRLFDGEADAVGRTVGLSVVGGARAGFYVRDVSRPMRSVGAELRPGAAEALLGAPADELAATHTPLADLWGAAADGARMRLLESPDDGGRLDFLEALLTTRLGEDPAIDPLVAHALRRFDGGAGVREVVAGSGSSHRRFIALFRRAVGLTPKRYCRVLRFQRALDRVPEHDSWVDLALAAGYSDQAHFNRDFREFAGVSPGAYLRAAPTGSRHVPVAPSISSKTAVAFHGHPPRAERSHP